nr:mannan endo-1,4-beta-mannosidase 6-like [Nicotiana tomentosiformis]
MVNQEQNFSSKLLLLAASCLLVVCTKGEMEDGEWTMVQKSGNQFVVNAQPFYVNGLNTYWLMLFAADQSTREKVTETFQQASAVGLSVCRTWAFNDGQWRALQKTPAV